MKHNRIQLHAKKKAKYLSEDPVADIIAVPLPETPTSFLDENNTISTKGLEEKISTL